MKTYGLIGKNIDYSFSRSFFKKKFELENLNCEYKNFDIDIVDKFPSILKINKKINGLNVTIPYKETIIPFLDEIDFEAQKIGAVNTIKIKNNKLIGYNTDHYGFTKTLIPYLNNNHNSALILGTGGASKAVSFALNKLKIRSQFVSRDPKLNKHISYKCLTKDIIKNNTIIINCTPIGTYPNIKDSPDIPYKHITQDHILFDLIYNPVQTKFLEKGFQAKAQTINGLRMLELQAEKSWKIWNK